MIEEVNVREDVCLTQTPGYMLFSKSAKFLFNTSISREERSPETPYGLPTCSLDFVYHSKTALELLLIQGMPS